MSIKDNQIKDFISGKKINSSSEEIGAVQPFSKILVEDYLYPKEHIQTHPQWRVKKRPSDLKKEYPIDIGIFDSKKHKDENLKIIVECKKKNRKDGMSQLKNYLTFSTAQLGVWFNGEEKLFIKKTESKGKVFFSEIPNIPRFGERLEDLGHFKRKNLRPSSNLKPVFKSIRNYLASNAVGITRDETFAQQLINLIFCKIYDERFTEPNSTLEFRAGIDEPHNEVKKRIINLYKKVKEQYDDVLDVADNITLDSKSLTYIVGELQLFSLQDSHRDAVGEAFEVFIGPSLKGDSGQFFTPRNVVKMVIDMIEPNINQKIIDPACGSGGFLIETIRKVWSKIDEKGEKLNWPDNEIEAEKQKAAIKNFRGIEKDDFLAKVAKAYMAIIGDGRGGIYCENSLYDINDWKKKTSEDIRPQTFDIVVTNPPFGKKLAIDDQELLSKYDLGHSWKENDEGVFEKKEILDKQPPQILFIERCFELLKDGGVMGIVLLESIFGMPKYKYVVDFIKKNSQILSIVTMPEDLFQPNTHAKCCVLICKKTKINKPNDIFMCNVKWCGHDSRGNPTTRINSKGEKILLDDIPNVAKIYKNKK